MKSDFSGCEISDLSVQAEESGSSFYKALAAKSKNKEAEQVLKFLAEEELEHARTFRELFQQSCDHDPEGAYTDEYFAYLRSLASSFLFTDKAGAEEAASKINSFSEGMDIGIQLEKDSILFYTEMKQRLREKDREKVDRIIEQEKKHLNKLSKMKGA